MSGGEVYMGIIPRLEEATFMTMVSTIMGRFTSLGTSMEASVSASAVRASQMAVTQAERTLAAQERIEAQAVQATERAEAAIVHKMQTVRAADEAAQRGIEQVTIATNNLLTAEERLAAIRDENSVRYQQQLRLVEAAEIRADQAARGEIATLQAQTAALDAATAAATRLADAQGAQLLASGEAAAARTGVLAAQRANAATEGGAAVAAAESASMAKYATGIGAVAVALGYATDKAGNFQKQQELLHTTAGLTQADVDKTGQAILDMAGEVGISANELSKGMFIIAKSGGEEFDSVPKRLDVLRAASQGAKEENANLDTVTKLLTTTMHDFKLDDPYEAMSKLKAAAGMSKSSLEQFSSAMSTVENRASAMGISMESLYADVAQFTQNGTTAAEATQQINNALAQFEHPSQNMQAMLADLGLNVADLKEQMKGPGGLGDAMQTIFNAASSRIGPDGKILIDAFNQVKTKGQDATIMFNNMTPAMQKLASEIANGEKPITAIRKNLNGFTIDQQGNITKYEEMVKAANGYSKTLQQGLADNQDLQQVMNTATGTMNGLSTALALTGNNAEEVNNKEKVLNDTHKEGDKVVQGYGSTQELMNQKLDEAKDKFGSLAIKLGNDFMPVAQGVLDIVNGIATAIDKLNTAVEWTSNHIPHTGDKNGLGDWVTAIPIVGGWLGHADGGLATGVPTGLFEGKGTTTSDENLVKISNKEYIVNAEQTAKHLPLLDAINYGTRGFKYGGYTGDEWYDDNDPTKPPIPGATQGPVPHVTDFGTKPASPAEPLPWLPGTPQADNNPGIFAPTVPKAPAPKSKPVPGALLAKYGADVADLPQKPGHATSEPTTADTDSGTWASAQDFPSVETPSTIPADDPLNVGVGHSIQATPLVMNNKSNFGVGAAIDRTMSWINSVLGRPYQYGGLDCSGFQSGIYNSLLGKNPLARAFSTVSDFLSLGFVKGSGGIYDIGVNPKPGMSGHMAGTFQGHRVESGGSHNNIMMDGDAVGADNAQFSDHYTLPGSRFNPPATDAAGNLLSADGTSSPNGSNSSASSSSSMSAEHLMTPKEAAEKAAGIAVDGFFETLGLSDSVFADPNRSLFGKLAGAGNALRFGATYDDAGNMTNPGVGVFGQPMPWDAEYITDSSGSRRKKTNTEQQEGRAAAAAQKAQEKTWLNSEKGQADMEGAQKHWDTAKKHLEQAAHSEALAAQTSDPTQKAKHLQAAKHYRELAAASQAAGDKAAGKGNMLLNPSSPATIAYDPKKGESQWSPLIHWALAHTNLPDADAARTGQQVRIESGGNPRAMSNAYPAGVAGGHPKGLLQVIDSTFASMRDPSLSSDIYDPAANLVAGLNWVTKRWGGPSKKWPTTAGYDEGGWLQPGITLVNNRTGKPEPVLNPQQKAQLDRAANNQQQGFGGDGAKGLVVIEEMHNHGADGREVGRDIARQFNTFAGGYSR